VKLSSVAPFFMSDRSHHLYHRLVSSDHFPSSIIVTLSGQGYKTGGQRRAYGLASWRVNRLKKGTDGHGLTRHVAGVRRMGNEETV
jgi:hypothetical protein